MAGLIFGEMRSIVEFHDSTDSGMTGVLWSALDILFKYDEEPF